MFCRFSRMSNLLSWYTARCYWNNICLKEFGKGEICLFSTEKIIFCTDLLGSGLKLIFHWFTKKREKLSSKNPAFVVSPSERSFIQVKNNNCPRIDPCGTHASIFVYNHSWPFHTTLCFLSFQKSVRILNRLLDITFCFDLKLRPLCHTISKALERSKNIDQTSWPLLKDL